MVRTLTGNKPLLLVLCEGHGKATVTSLAPGFAGAGMSEADMPERAIGPADPARLSFPPFEVKTFVARRAGP